MGSLVFPYDVWNGDKPEGSLIWEFLEKGYISVLACCDSAFKGAKYVMLDVSTLGFCLYLWMNHNEEGLYIPFQNWNNWIFILFLLHHIILLTLYLVWDDPSQ